ncbi:MAG: CapA family protein [Erysipelotrichaceae bacterium]
MRKWFIILCSSFLLMSCARDVKEPVVVPITNPSEYKASLMMVGDALIHMNVMKSATLSDGSLDFTDALQFIKPIVKNYDLAFYNQESPIAGNKWPLAGYPVFNTPRLFPDTMIDMGFNMINLANNHTLDMGVEGAINSLAYFRTKDVMTSGSYSSQADQDQIRTFEKNHISFVFLSYAYGSNNRSLNDSNQYLLNLYEKSKVEAEIAKYRDLVDFVIVSLHAGEENSFDESYQAEWVKVIADAGADLIIGHHVHVVQPVQYIGETLVFNSLGNFISSQLEEKLLVELIATLDFVKYVDGDTVTTSIKNVKIDLMYDYYNADFTELRVYPLKDIPSDLLPNKEALYTKYMKIVTKYVQNLTIGGIFD